jgi:seryl-tRNA synthetase
MIDIQMLRNEAAKLSEMMLRRGVKKELLDQIIALDLKRRAITQEVEQMQFERNTSSKKMGELIRQGIAIEEQKKTLKQLGDDIQLKAGMQKELEVELELLLQNLPNLPHESVPEGMGEEDNIVVRSSGVPRSFDFDPRPHEVLGQMNGTMDMDRGSKLAGSKFMVLKDEGAFYSRALMNFMLNHARSRGYREIIPPFMVRREILIGSGQLPKFEEDLYKIEGEEAFLIPTGEVPLVNLFREEIVSEELLPLRLTACTPCFRKEAGAAGKEGKGLIRLHQFDKVELVCLCEAEKSFDMLESLTLDAEELLKKLGLPYRVVLLCTGDMSGFSTAKTYDIEVWFPSMNKYVEISSCSNCTDFQARRASLRYRNSDGKVTLLHTLNGSGLAIGRCLAAVMENYQQSDGSIAWPDVLK